MPRNNALCAWLCLAAPKVRYSYGSFNFLFFQEATKSLVECPNAIYAFNRTGSKYDVSHPTYHGLVNMEQISKCTIITNKFQLLPKSPAKGDSNFADKIKPVFVLDTELLKATIRFEENQNKKQEHQEPNPWHQINTISNKDDIKVFGNHTILVQSIAMFLILSLLLILLAICVMNFLHYTPKFLQEHVRISHYPRLVTLQMMGIVLSGKSNYSINDWCAFGDQ